MYVNEDGEAQMSKCMQHPMFEGVSHVSHHHFASTTTLITTPLRPWYMMDDLSHTVALGTLARDIICHPGCAAENYHNVTKKNACYLGAKEPSVKNNAN